MNAHPATAIFPMMSEADLQELADDIRANGLQVPVVVHQGLILDGRNRWRACEIAGVTPRTIERTDGGSPLAYVISLNLKRRHLTPSERAAAAVNALPMYEAEARERMLAGKAPDPTQKIEQGEASAQVAKLFGVNRQYIFEAKKMKEQSPEVFDAVSRGEVTLTEARRSVKEQGREDMRQHNQSLVENAPPALLLHQNGQRYQTIVLDPPWDWGDEGDVDQLGRARPTYATMPLEEIAALPIGALAADNAHIYLWITNRSLPKGFGLLDGWGFRYITALTWVKAGNFGMGNYFRGSTEHVLFGIRGSLPLLRQDVGTHFLAPRGSKHSEKPDAFYELAESCSPGPWLEMFGRKERPGWTVWGAESGNQGL